jgi:ABC-type glycerol-3-phosphate transport system permease component
MNNFFLVLVLGFTLIPPFINIIPLYVIMMKLRLIDTYLALIITYVAWLAPLNTWIMKSFFDSIPPSVEEASLTDGCTRFQSLWRIVIPIAKPGLVAAIAISFVMAWGEFIVALVFTSSDTMRTVSVGAYNYLGYFEKSFGPLCAFSTIIILPVLVLFLSIRKQFMKGMIEGAIK